MIIVNFHLAKFLVRTYVRTDIIGTLRGPCGPKKKVGEIKLENTKAHLECCFSSLPVLLGRLRITGPSTLPP